MNKFIIVLAVVAIANASPFSTCGSPKGTVSKVEIEGCSDSDKTCVLKKGHEAKLSITFKSDVDVEKLTVKAYGVIAGMPLPYPLPQSDACSAGVHCPLKSGVEATYSQVFNVQRGYPSLSLKVKWTMLNEKNELITCVLIPVKLS